MKLAPDFQRAERRYYFRISEGRWQSVPFGWANPEGKSVLIHMVVLWMN